MKLTIIANQLRKEGRALIEAANALDGVRKPVTSERRMHWTQTPIGRKRIARIARKSWVQRKGGTVKKAA